MITKIGLVAGDIWNCLEKNEGTISLKDLMKSVNESSELILMSIGWLAREGHVILNGENGSYMITLIER